MHLHTIRSIVDFGLLVLIWVIQLIVYPSFSYYAKENLLVWHKKYMPLIAYVVAPLMLLQLGIYAYQTYILFNVLNVLGTLLVVAVWAITFVQFVPMHRAISEGGMDDRLLSSLVKKNWSRTILWTLLFLLGTVSYFKV